MAPGNQTLKTEIAIGRPSFSSSMLNLGGGLFLGVYFFFVHSRITIATFLSELKKQAKKDTPPEVERAEPED